MLPYGEQDFYGDGPLTPMLPASGFCLRQDALIK